MLTSGILLLNLLWGRLGRRKILDGLAPLLLLALYFSDQFCDREFSDFVGLAHWLAFCIVEESTAKARDLASEIDEDWITLLE